MALLSQPVLLTFSPFRLHGNVTNLVWLLVNYNAICNIEPDEFIHRIDVVFVKEGMYLNGVLVGSPCH